MRGLLDGGEGVRSQISNNWDEKANDDPDYDGDQETRENDPSAFAHR
jgi:hypothetical protein